MTRREIAAAIRRTMATMRDFADARSWMHQSNCCCRTCELNRRASELAEVIASLEAAEAEPERGELPYFEDSIGVTYLRKRRAEPAVPAARLKPDAVTSGALELYPNKPAVGQSDRRVNEVCDRCGHPETDMIHHRDQLDGVLDRDSRLFDWHEYRPARAEGSDG